MQILDYLKAKINESEAGQVNPDNATAEDYEQALAELGVVIDN